MCGEAPDQNLPPPKAYIWEFRQLRPSEPLAQKLLVGATKQSVHVAPDVASGDSPAALEQLAIPAIATTSATGSEGPCAGPSEARNGDDDVPFGAIMCPHVPSCALRRALGRE